MAGFLDKLFRGPLSAGASTVAVYETEQELRERKKALLKRVRKLELVTRRIVNDVIAGSYHSAFKGRGMDFDEVRLYQPGDEVRFIDWNVSARMDELYVKQFVEERELTVFILFDASASQIFGTGERTKKDAAAEIAAMLAFSAIKNNDRVGLIMFTDQIERFVPPKKGRKHVLRVIREILEFEPERIGTNIAGALDYFSRVSRRRSICFVLSDFQDKEYRKPLMVASRRHDMVPVVLIDPAEEELPNIGTAALEDAETGEVLYVDTASRAGRKRFRQLVQEVRQRREKLFRRMKIDFIAIRTDEAFYQPIVDYFRLRARRY